MAFYDNLTNYLSTFYISDEDVQTHQDVATAQAAIVKDQYDRGVIDYADYKDLMGDIADAGDYLAKYKEDNGGATGLFKTIPWWGWGIILIVPLGFFVYMGGLTLFKGILKKK